MIKAIKMFVFTVFLIFCNIVNTVVDNVPKPATPTVTPTPTQLVIPTVTPTQKPATPTPLVLSPTPTATPDDGMYTVQPGDTLAEIANRFGVSVDYLAAVNGIDNPDFIYSGQLLKIPNWPPEPPTPDITEGREIIVVLSTQRTYAFEDGKLVNTFIVSTGLPGTPTLQGHFHIYLKARYLDMNGPGYTLPEVPWNMCFIPKGLGYCLHGTYWHDSFGQPMSHGCVNLTEPDAEWLYNWSEVDDVVWVIP